MANFIKDGFKRGCAVAGIVGVGAGLTGIFAPAVLAGFAAAHPVGSSHGRYPQALALGASWALANPLLLLLGGGLCLAIGLNKD